jgi:hypothetical protein
MAQTDNQHQMLRERTLTRKTEGDPTWMRALHPRCPIRMAHHHGHNGPNGQQGSEINKALSKRVILLTANANMCSQ